MVASATAELGPGFDSRLEQSVIGFFHPGWEQLAKRGLLIGSPLVLVSVKKFSFKTH